MPILSSAKQLKSKADSCSDHLRLDEGASEARVKDDANENPVLVIPCSGIGKVHGLISREATYLVTDELARVETDTLCLALLVKGDPEAVADVLAHDCITIDCCGKACA